MVQLRFLRLHSSTATQSMTYSCHPGHRLGLTDTEVKFLADTKRQSYLGIIQDCLVCFLSLTSMNLTEFLFTWLEMFSKKVSINDTKIKKYIVCINLDCSALCEVNYDMKVHKHAYCLWVFFVCVSAWRGEHFRSSSVCVWVRGPPPASSSRCSSKGESKLHTPVWIQCGPSVL